MNSKKNEDSGQQAIAAAPLELIRLLDRLVELGWVSRWWLNATTRTRVIVWTPAGRERFALLRDTVDALGYHGLHSWIAMDALMRGVAGEDRFE